MSAQHTPGPWRLGKDSGSVVADTPVEEVEGSDAVEYYGGHLVAESIAPRNGHVIAAAPELLEALRQLRIDANRLCDRNLGGTYEDDCRRAIAKADVALAKAQGLS